MQLPHDDVDPGGLIEYSVVFTDRSLNHMSARFAKTMQDLTAVLRRAYGAESVAVVPGGGTAAMESVARQLATNQRCLVIRNGLFSYRWSQILEAGRISDDITVLQARAESEDPRAAWRPAPIEEVVTVIRETRPQIVIAPHVETASGIVLPDEYLRAVSEAVHEVGGLFVLDCIASGALWIDMRASGVDVLLSAPQKGWSGSPGAGFVMLNANARRLVQESSSSSFTLDLGRWLWIADEYLEGRTPYHSTMPTDSLVHNTNLMAETEQRGFEALRNAQAELGTRVRSLLAERGYASVAASEFAAPSVVVMHTDDPELQTGARMKPHGLQIAAGVPLQCGEPSSFSSFRIGLFGLDKLSDVEGTVSRLMQAFDELEQR